MESAKDDAPACYDILVAPSLSPKSRFRSVETLFAVSQTAVCMHGVHA